MNIQADRQESEGQLIKLRGHAEVETTEFVLRADEIDYDSETQEAEARGHVRYRRFTSGEDIHADLVQYNLGAGTGRFFEVQGTTPAKVEAKPGLLMTSTPFSFSGRWAQRIENRYILYDGMITNCIMPGPWWTIRGPRFDIIPTERAIGYNAIFRLRRVPLFYTPAYYKSLERFPRRSGFLTPNIGNSSRRGFMLGLGYYWVINRSYDLTYRNQYFSERGFAHNVDFRGKPREGTDFNVLFYGVNDRGRLVNETTRVKEGGFLMNFLAKSDLGNGWTAKTNYNYLTSFTFRQAFSDSFNEAIYSEVHSIGYVTKHWNDSGVNFVAQRDENYQSNAVGDKIVLQKLPQAEFVQREHEVVHGRLPVWFSLDAEAGFVDRNQPQFATSQFIMRLDFRPRVTTALRWKGFQIVPSFTLHETQYGGQLSGDRLDGRNILRSAREVSVDLVIPSLARVYQIKGFLGERMKHVIEPIVQYRHVDGITDFNRFIRYDEIETLNNTDELQVGVINRLYTKLKDGRVQDVFSWEIRQTRYFDPTFGGALVEGRRNVLLSSLLSTPFAFLDQPRNYSPVTSILRAQPTYRLGVEWRADYDPLRTRVVNSSLSADARFDKLFLSVGHSQIRSVSQLSPNSNELRGLIGLGQENKRGWNTGVTTSYDYRLHILRYANSQITYNTDCCGFSVQYRRASYGIQNDNQFRVQFQVANIGSFGTLKRQERIY